VPWSKEDQDFALNLLEKLRHEKPELFRSGDLLSRRFIGVQYPGEFGDPNYFTRVQYNFEYHFSSGWCVAKVILSVRKQEDRLLEYRVYHTSKSVNNYSFEFSGDEKIALGSPGYPYKYFVKTYEDGEVRRAWIVDEKDTNMGTLRVVRKEWTSKDGFSDDSYLVLNFKEIYGGGGHIKIYGVFYINTFSHILIGESCSGTGCRIDDLSLLIIEVNGKVKKIRTKDFYSEDNSTEAYLKGNEIIINLGLYKGQEKTAVYRNNEINILYKRLPYQPLTSGDCGDLYEIARGCIRLREFYGVNKCEESTSRYDGLSNSQTWALRYISNEPGFNQELFSGECLNACKRGDLPEYNEFAERVCGLKAP
jgi:hypothetical protein